MVAVSKSFVSSLLFTATLCMGLSACSSGPGEDKFAPEILAVYSNIIHRHPSFYAKWPERTQRSIDFYFSVNVSDPQGIGDILNVYVRDMNENYVWTLFDASQANPWKDCYRGAGVFECRLYPENHLDYTNLKNLEVVVKDRRGYTRRQGFSHLLADGEQPDTERFVYSSQFTGNTTNGYPALGVMTILDNHMVFTANPGTQSFHVEFTVTDSRASNYSLDFYDDTDDANYLGSAPVNSGSIESQPIVFGQTTVIDIPWSEIDFESVYSVEDIKQMHITLYDNPIPWIINNKDEGEWYNHLATSQVIALSE